MAEEPNKEKQAKTETSQPTATPTKPQGEQRPRIELDDAEVVTTYANFCRVTGTPEELIVDFGLNLQPFGTPQEPVKVNQRIVVNYFTAKRMLQALHLSVQRHEQAFGVLETDVQKRVVGRPQGT